MTDLSQPTPTKPSFFHTRLGRIVIVIGACLVVANGIRAVWDLTRSTQDRIAADVQALRTAPNDYLREQAMKRLSSYRDADNPPVAPVVEVGTSVFNTIKSTQATYRDNQFGFFLWAVGYLERHDRTGESLELLRDLKDYVPRETLSTGYKMLQNDATVAWTKITLRVTKQSMENAEKQALENLRKSLDRPAP